MHDGGAGWSTVDGGPLGEHAGWMGPLNRPRVHVGALDWGVRPLGGETLGYLFEGFVCGNLVTWRWTSDVCWCSMGLLTLTSVWT